MSHRYSHGETPKEVIVAALKGERYPMQLVAEDAAAFIAAVNKGIDSHLEAMVDTTAKWEQFRVCSKLVCSVGAADMLVLLRRLYEDGSSTAWDLRSSILTTLEIEEV